MESKRALARRKMTEDIIAAGFAQLDRGGPDAVNLRAVARELGVVSSAVYRYVSDRDEFLTLLIENSFRSLADTVEADAGPFPTLALAMRRWALRYPNRWALIYGTPIAGYAAPARTVEQGTRVVRMFLRLLHDAPPADTPSVSPGLHNNLDSIQSEWAPQLNLGTIELALEAWTRLLGLISAEIFGHLGRDTLSAPEEFFRRSVQRIARSLGLGG